MGAYALLSKTGVRLGVRWATLAPFAGKNPSISGGNVAGGEGRNRNVLWGLRISPKPFSSGYFSNCCTGKEFSIYGGRIKRAKGN